MIFSSTSLVRAKCQPARGRIVFADGSSSGGGNWPNDFITAINSFDITTLPLTYTPSSGNAGLYNAAYLYDISSGGTSWTRGFYTYNQATQSGDYTWFDYPMTAAQTESSATAAPICGYATAGGSTSASNGDGTGIGTSLIWMGRGEVSVAGPYWVFGWWPTTREYGPITPSQGRLQMMVQGFAGDPIHGCQALVPFPIPPFYEPTSGTTPGVGALSGTVNSANPISAVGNVAQYIQGSYFFTNDPSVMQSMLAWIIANPSLCGPSLQFNPFPLANVSTPSVPCDPFFSDNP